MVLDLEEYPFILKAARELAYEAGAVHRWCTEEQALRTIAKGIDGCSRVDLLSLDKFLAGMQEADFHTILCGEHDDICRLCTGAPLGQDGEPAPHILNVMFDSC